MKELIIILAVLVVGGLLAIVAFAARCEGYWAEKGRKAEFTIDRGCVVEPAKKTKSKKIQRPIFTV